MLTQADRQRRGFYGVNERPSGGLFLAQSAVLLFSMANSLGFTFLMIKTCFCFF